MFASSLTGQRWILFALLAAAPAFAQQPGMGGPPTPGGGSQPSSANPGMPSADSEQAEMRKMADQSFVRDTMENDEAQVRLSQLAQQKSPSPDVKQFSAQMAKVNTELNTQFDPAAKQLGLDEPKGPSKKEKKEIAKLEALSGPEFDAAYLQAMAEQQRQSLKRFHDESQDDQSPTLQQAAQQDAPILTQDFQLLEKLAQAHSVDLGAGEKK